MIKLKILDVNWNIHLWHPDKFDKEFKDEEAAVTLTGLNKVIFNIDELSLTIVKHELWHCFRSSLCTHAAKLSSDQEEEISAELFAVHGDYIIRMSRQLYKSLKNMAEDIE